MPPTLNKRQ